MRRHEFLSAIYHGLQGLPQEDINKSIEYYGEMIDDLMEDGMTEEEAIASIGPVNEIIAQILSETSLPKLVKAKVKTKHTLKAWEIILIILGSPLWISLLIAAFAIVLSVYIVLWSIIISLYAVNLSFAACGIAGIVSSLIHIPSGNPAVCFFYAGAGIACIGIAILLFFGFNQITKGIVILSKYIMLGIKSCFIKKENRNEKI